MITDSIPQGPGIYLLHIQVKEDLSLKVGSLGERFFSQGDYLYIGSAQNGLRNRIAHHLGKKKNLYWHIDYLLADDRVEVKDVLWREGAGKKEECNFVFFLWYFGDAIKGFGSTDCKCESHLYLLKEDKIIEKLKETFLSQAAR